jgi:hypothetical protein
MLLYHKFIVLLVQVWPTWLRCTKIKLVVACVQSPDSAFAIAAHSRGPVLYIFYCRWCFWYVIFDTLKD